MKKQKLITSLLLFIAISISAQEKPKVWDLTSCMDYALKNNIQIQLSKVSLEQNAVTLKNANAQLLPNLSASINQNFTNYPTTTSSTNNIYSGNYGISSSILLFDGGKTLKNIEQQKLLEKMGQYNVQYAQKNIQFSILQSFMQILYANETVNIDSSAVEISKTQFDQGNELLRAGSISKVDLAQLESQFSSDKYQLVVAKNNLETQKLSLKQLLELTVNDEMEVAIPTLNDIDILKLLPKLSVIYDNSLNVMPQLKSSKLNIQVAQLETDKAKAAFLPKVNLNASVGTNHSTVSSLGFGQQLQDGLSDGVGVSVSIPIFTNRNNKSALEIDKLSEKTNQLDLQNTEKSLLTTIESLYQDAVSAQNQYVAANEKVKALQISYDLIDQQFKLGLKSPLDLMTEKNNLLTAKQSMTQAKYLSIMNLQMLNLYQELPLEIK